MARMRIATGFASSASPVPAVPRSRARTRLFLGRMEDQRGRVQAVAQSRGSGPVVEDVTEVSITAGAKDFRPPHSVALVLMRDDIFLGDRLEETGPAGAGIEFGVGRKEGQLAADTG